MISNIQLLAVDLDDTLLTDEFTISCKNKNALLQAEDAGVTVVLATGRPLESTLRYAEEMGMMSRESYLITGNGTLLIRSDTRQELIHHNLPMKESLDAIRYLKKRNIPVMIYHKGTISVSQENRWVDEDCRISGFKKVIIDDYESFIRDASPQKILIPGDPDYILELESVLREQFGNVFHIFTSKPFFLEFIPKEADKGIALQYLATHLCIPQSSVMAIGDSMNDLGMITYAGVGVAVGNAHIRIKNVASSVTSSTHQDDAVAEAVRRYIL